MIVDVANPDLLSSLSVVIKWYEHSLISICTIIVVAVIKPCRFAIAGSNVCSLSGLFEQVGSWKEGMNAAFLICWEMPRWSDCGSINTPPCYLLDNFPASPGLFPCRTWTSQMSVILPQLSEAIMTICSALFLVIRSMFSHETLDPSNQSLLSRACGPCLNHTFMSSTAAAVWWLKF